MPVSIIKMTFAHQKYWSEKLTKQTSDENKLMKNIKIV